MREPDSQQDPTAGGPEPSLRAIVHGGFIALVGTLVMAGIASEPSLRSAPVLTSVGIAGAAGGAAVSMLRPQPTAARLTAAGYRLLSLLAYGTAVGAGFAAARLGPF